MGSVIDRRQVERAARVLNEALSLDPVAVNALVSHRVPCNARLADHPTIQVGAPAAGEPGNVGMLGVINGILGVDAESWGALVAIVDDKNEVLEFRALEDRLPKEDA